MNDYFIKFNIKTNLQNIRKVNKLRQEDVANALGINRSTYTSWELGRSLPKPAQLAQLSKLFDCSVDFLINEHESDAFSVSSSIPYETDKKVYGDSYLSELTDEERAFLLKFRLLNSRDKEQLDEFINNIRIKDE